MQINANIIMLIMSKLNVLLIFEIFKIIDKNIVVPVDIISAIKAGFMLFSVAFTLLHFKIFLINIDIINIITKAGSTTPMVERSEPNIPPCVEPINVAILMAIGPGVDSDTAIMFNNSSSVNQLLERTSSFISGIIAYPPPKDIAPIFRKVRKSLR